MGLEMLQVARLAPRLLGDSGDLVRVFLFGQLNDDGGFKDRSGRSDLYYSVFGVSSLLALQADVPWPKIFRYLKSFDEGAGMDFVHLCCLARGWGLALRWGGLDRADAPNLDAIIQRIETHRSTDGGYNNDRQGSSGSAYGCFLGLGAYQDLQLLPPEPLRMVQCLKLLEVEEGAWANDRSMKLGTTPSTAAAITVLRNLDLPLNAGVAGDWLLRQVHSQGGFKAMPMAPIPDLLSTATALHALAGLQVSLDPIKDSCLDFIDSLWTNAGSFHGHWEEDMLDCEYTFYGLLALGHLSL